MITSQSLKHRDVGLEYKLYRHIFSFWCLSDKDKPVLLSIFLSSQEGQKLCLKRAVILI